MLGTGLTEMTSKEWDRGLLDHSAKDVSPLIRLEQITKLYGKRPVLEDVSMDVDYGTITALIGRNGSGKSTLLSILAGLIYTSSGKVSRGYPDMVIGYAPEAFPAIKFTPEEYLRSMGRISGLSPKKIESNIGELLTAFHLESFRTQPIVSFSKGMLQKINLIQSLMLQPALLLLDEPMSGLDLPAMHKLVDLLLELKQKGTAIVFSVHEPQWIEILADQVHVLQSGKTVTTIKGSENLRVKPTTYIRCMGLPSHEQLLFEKMPGFISLNKVKESNVECLGLTVQSSASDDFLRVILSLGGSIRAVEPRGGHNGLEMWMSPREEAREASL